MTEDNYIFIMAIICTAICVYRLLFKKRIAMTDKEKLIKIKSLADEMYNAAFNLTTDASLLRKAMEEYHQFIIYKYYKEEPVSEELEKASKEWLIPQLDKSYANYGETKMMELTHFDGYAMLDAIEFGAKWQKQHLWKPADGDDLLEYDREVIVLTQPYPLEGSEFAVSFAHRPDPKGWDAKSIITEKVEHYTPETYDKGGWNIPDIVYWLDVNLPKEIEL